MSTNLGLLSMKFDLCNQSPSYCQEKGVLWARLGNLIMYSSDDLFSTLVYFFMDYTIMFFTHAMHPFVQELFSFYLLLVAMVVRCIVLRETPVFFNRMFGSSAGGTVLVMNLLSLCSLQLVHRLLLLERRYSNLEHPQRL